MGGSTRRIYPEANTTAQWWETAFDRVSFTGIEKILLHTTETTSWPGYKSGASAPTLTYHPRLRAWRQHNFLDRSARALVDPTSTPVRENRDNVIQIEIVAYADEAVAKTVGGLAVTQISDAALKDLGDFIGWVHQQWGGPPLVAARFIAYPGSYGASSVRMTSSQYDAFRGVLGHQHASGNAHGDPGALNVPRIMQHAAAYVAGTTTAPPPSPQEDDMSMTPTERAALIADIADAVWDLPVNRDGGKVAAIQELADAKTFARVAAAGVVDPVELAGALLPGLIAGLPQDGQPVTDEQLERALRNVLGSLNDPPTPA